MKKVFTFIVVLAVLAATAWVYVRYMGGSLPFLSAYINGDKGSSSATKQSASQSDEEQTLKDVVATVKAAPVRQGMLTETRVWYGTVVPGKGSLVTVSAPYECKVIRILVRKGQEVAKGDRLMEVGPSEDSRLALEQAQNKSDMAKQELARVKQRLSLRLATNQELLQATQAERDARLLVKSLERKGMTKPIMMKAAGAGVINAISVQEGAFVVQGAPLLDIATLSKLEARLGAEPDVVPMLSDGKMVAVSSLGKTPSGTFECPIRGIARTVDPNTHLVNVYATLSKGSGLMLGEPVQGKIQIKSVEGLIVPRSAALPEEGHYSVFVLKGGHAHKVAVNLGMSNAAEVEVRSRALHAGDMVAVLGNYELEDGMAVTVSAAS